MNKNAMGWRVGSVAAIVIVISFVWWMNLGYDKVSDKGYQFAMALISICNQQDAERLNIMVEQIDHAVADGDLPQADAQVLLTIADRARAGKWDSAAHSVRRLMIDQINK